MARRERDERGAYAILFAILAVFLMSLAAFAVDIGNAVARKSDVQGQADFSALAAATQLTEQTSGTIPTAVLDAVRLSMNDNQPVNRNGACVSTTHSCITSNTQLTDGNLTNGEVRWANGGLEVITQNEKVDYGFARVMGFQDTQVQGRATVGVFSPLSALPLYAVNPCDFGRQTVTDPANGHTSPVSLPTLASDTETNGTTLQSPATPYAVGKDATGEVITLSGVRWDTTKVGFFPSDGGAPVLATGFSDPSGTVHYEATPTNYTTTNGSSSDIRFTVPATVTAREIVWFVRVFNPASGGKWSDKTDAPPLRVGEPVLECDAGSSDGNFGTLKFPRTDVSSSNDQIAMNIATKPQAPLTITVHQQWNSSGLCSDGVNLATTSELPNPGMRPGTNCMDTDTGLPAGAATSGMISGISATSTKGRLTDRPTRTGCAPGGGSSMAVARVSNTNYNINNDVLSCYLINGKSLADITARNYTGDDGVDPSIFDSPRFFFVPVLHVEPTSGGSNRYSIVDMRPAFLTDEVVASSSVKGSDTATHPSGSGNSVQPGNGIYVEQNQVKQMKVIFFNFDALPDRVNGNTGLTQYYGVGPRIIRLID